MPLIDDNMDDYNEPTAPDAGLHDVKIATAILGKSWDNSKTGGNPSRPQISLGLLLQDDVENSFAMQWLRLTFTERGDDRHAENMLNIKRASAVFDIDLEVFGKPEEEFDPADFVGAKGRELKYARGKTARDDGTFPTFINLPQLEN